LNIVNTTLGFKPFNVLRFEGFNITKKMLKKVFIKAPSGAFFVFNNRKLKLLVRRHNNGQHSGKIIYKSTFWGFFCFIKQKVKVVGQETQQRAAFG
jgi:hypothetical protein